MSKQETIWVASQPDLWRGYGLTGIGRTEKEARDAFWNAYKSITRRRIKSGAQDEAWKTFKALDDYAGVYIREYEIGQGYFGDESVADHRRWEQKRKKTK